MLIGTILIEEGLHLHNLRNKIKRFLILQRKMLFLIIGCSYYRLKIICDFCTVHETILNVRKKEKLRVSFTSRIYELFKSESVYRVTVRQPVFLQPTTHECPVP